MTDSVIKLRLKERDFRLIASGDTSSSIDMLVNHIITALSSFAFVALAAFPPKPENVTIVRSTKFPGVSISFKEASLYHKIHSYSADGM